jgi:hypothetical protein
MSQQGENARRARGRALGRSAFLGTALSLAMGLMCCSRAWAGDVPGFNSSEAGTFDHESGTPVADNSPTFEALPISSTPPALTKDTIDFNDDYGYSTASAGLQNSQSSTQTKIIISSGTGVNQVDPESDETASSLEVFFEAEWFVDATGFGPPISGNFSLPIGVKVGINGSASVSVKVDWDYTDGEDEFGLGEYTGSKSFSNIGGTKTLNEVTSLTAPTQVFTPNAIPGYSGIILTGDIIFTADADDPTLIEVPTAADFGDLGVTSDQFGSFSMDINPDTAAVPEPVSAVLMPVGCGAALLLELSRRRKSRLVRIPVG